MSRHPGITRRRVMLRARYGWPKATVLYNRSGFHEPDRYRTDAAGFISMCYAIPPHGIPHSVGGLSTVTLLTDGWMEEIDARDLRVGDAIGYLGLDSVDADGGSIVIFEKFLNDDPSLGMALTWDFLPIVSPGPDRRARPIDRRWHCYRFKYILDNEPAEVGTSV